MQEETRQAADARPPDYFPADKPWHEEGGVVCLVGMRCGACGTRAFPARPVCSQCAAQDGLARYRLAPHGTLYTFSEVHVAPKDFPAPYVIGFIDIDGVRVFGQIEGTAASLACDQQVEATTGVVRVRANGTPVISYKFRSIPA